MTAVYHAEGPWSLNFGARSFSLSWSRDLEWLTGTQRFLGMKSFFCDNHGPNILVQQQFRENSIKKIITFRIVQVSPGENVLSKKVPALVAR